MLEQPWLLVALAIYAINLGLAYFIQVPRLRRLIGLRSGSDPRWPTLARRQRYISYVMAGLVGTIGFLMSTKPVALVSAMTTPARPPGPGATRPACSAGSWPARSRRPASPRTSSAIAIRDIAPRAPTHVLVLPREHIPSAADLTDADAPLIGRAVRHGRGRSRARRGSPRAATGS